MDTLLGTLKTVIYFIVGSYLIVCGLLYLGQRKILYYPQPAAEFDGLQTVQFQHKGITLRGWIINPGRSRAILYYGGNAEQIEYNAGFFQSYLPDYSVYLIAYRGYGRSEGKPSESALYSDAEYVYDQIKDRHQRIIIMGRSLGTGVATHMAVNRPVAKLILVSPYDSIENIAKHNYWMIPVGLLLRDKYRSWQRAPHITKPTLIVYAEQDRVVAPERTQALIEYFSPNLLSVVSIDGVNHASVGDSPEFKNAVTRFLLE